MTLDRPGHPLRFSNGFKRLRRTSLTAALLGLAALGGCVDETAEPGAETERDGALPDSTPPGPDLAPPDVGLEDFSALRDAAVIDAAPPEPCATEDDCAAGEQCVDGLCAPPACTPAGGCPQLQGCLEGACVDQCFGPGTCFRGGICIDNLCHPPECAEDADCADGGLCRGQACVPPAPCADDAACGDEERCVAGNCEPLTECGGDRNCAADEICEDGRCRPQPACALRADCDAGFDCVGGRCVPFVCRGDADCGAGELCNAGACAEPDPALEVAQVVILNRPRALAIGQQLALRAVALDLRGDIVARTGFTWAIDAANPDAVDAGSVDADGTLTAGPMAGPVRVTARLGAVLSDALVLQVYEAPAAAPETYALRLTHAETGAPVVGARVESGGTVGQSDARGQVFFEPAPQGPVTVFADGHDYVTLVGLPAGAWHLPLPRRSDFGRVAGLTGTVDFGRVTSEGGLELGLAGASLGGGLSNLSLGSLIGDLFNVPVEVAGFGVNLPLPGGLVLAAELPFIGRIAPKTDFKVTARPGFQLGWAFAGRIDTDVLFRLAGGGGGGGGFDAGAILGTVLPFFDQFQHGLRVADNLVALPRQPDVDDVDGDGDVAELQPDYARFPVLNNQPDQAQRLRLTVAVPALPAGEGTPIALLFAGSELESVGFVPLGVSSATEAGPVPMRLAAPYGGLEGGDLVVLALAARFGDGSVLPEDVSARIRRFAGNVPPDVSLGADFLALPAAAEYDPVMRRLDAGAVDGATLHRAVFGGPNGAWHVWFADGEAPALTLPFPPQGQPDLAAAASVRVEAIELSGETTLLDLAREDGAASLLDLDRLTAGFSRAVP